MQLLDVSSFSQKYGVLEKTVYNVPTNHSSSSKAYVLDGRTLFINEGYFLRRKEFKFKIISQSHQYYYTFNKHLSEYSIARMINEVDGKSSVYSWLSFLRLSLFSVTNDSILNYRVNKMLWRFWRACRTILRYMFYKSGVSPTENNINRFIGLTLS